PPPFRDLLEHPPRALREVARLHGATAQPAPEELTVLSYELQLTLMRFAPAQLLVDTPHCRMALVVGIPDPSGLPDLLVALEAEQLVELGVRPHDDAVLDERNAQGGRLENRALLLATDSESRGRPHHLLADHAVAL